MENKDNTMMIALAPLLLRELGIGSLVRKEYRFSVSDEAYENLWDGLCFRVRKLIKPSAYRMFVEYLHHQDALDAYIENIETDALDEVRNAFMREITEHSAQVLRDRVPTLITFVEDTVKTYQSVVNEMLERLEASCDTVSHELLCDNPFHTILRIDADTGDLHNHGHCTSVIVTDAGTIVYKPHDITIDQKSCELIDTFFSDVMRAPRVVCGENFGFTEFIENKPADTEESARQYIYNLGGFAAAVTMLGSSDLHHNNILSDGVHPVIIDYELMLMPGKIYREGSLADDLEHSIFYSSLMPMRKDHSELSILFAQDEECKSSPVVNGERKNMLDYPEEFFAGYETIYCRCMDRREELKSFAAALGSASVRHIYRNTGTYSTLLEKMMEPPWIEDPNLREAVISNLSYAAKRMGNEETDLIAEAEADSLLRGDIPYFYMKCGSRDLYADERVVYQDFFGQTCIDNLCVRIDHLSEADLVFEQALLKKAMTRVIRTKPAGMKQSEPIKEAKPISDEALLHHAEALFLEIAEDVIVTPHGDRCWFGPDYFVKTGMELMNTGLVSGIAGLAVFFAALQSMTNDEEIRKRCEELLEAITRRLERQMEELGREAVIYPAREGISWSDGLAGKLLAFHLIEKYTNDARYTDLSRKCLANIRKVDLSQEKIDVFAGIAGLLKVLCRYEDCFNEPGVRKFCEELAERLLSSAIIPFQNGKLWRTLRPRWAMSGAGHGQSGIATALYEAGKRLGRDDFIKAAETGLAFEDSIYSPALGAWPDRRRIEKSDTYITGYCSGAPGIGMQAITCGYENAETMISRAVESTLREPFAYKDFLCCGNCARIEFLLEAGHLKEARARMAMIIERAERNGYYHCLTENVTEVFSPGLLYGVSGIGYTMLRLIDPEHTESVLI